MKQIEQNTQETTKKNWLLTPPDGKEFAECLQDACYGNERMAKLLAYFTSQAHFEAERQKLTKGCKVVTFTRKHEDILKMLKVNISRKTLIHYLDLFDAYGYVTSKRYQRSFTVNIEKLRDVFQAPPERKKRTPYDRRKSCSFTTFEKRQHSPSELEQEMLNLREEVVKLQQNVELLQLKVVKLQQNVELLQLPHNASEHSTSDVRGPKNGLYKYYINLRETLEKESFVVASANDATYTRTLEVDNSFRDGTIDDFTFRVVCEDWIKHHSPDTYPSLEILDPVEIDSEQQANDLVKAGSVPQDEDESEHHAFTPQTTRDGVDGEIQAVTPSKTTSVVAPSQSEIEALTSERRNDEQQQADSVSCSPSASEQHDEVEQVQLVSDEALGPPVMPPATMKWCAEKLVQIVEAKRFVRGKQGARFSTDNKRGKSQRDRQLDAARKILARKVSEEEYIRAYDSRNDPWWNEHQGSLTVERMAENTPRRVMRVVELLEEVESKSPAPSQQPPSNVTPIRDQPRRSQQPPCNVLVPEEIRARNIERLHARAAAARAQREQATAANR